MRNTSLLENVAKELIVLREFTDSNIHAFDLHSRILANKLNIDTFNDLVAFYTLKTKEFAARNPKLSLQKSHINYLIEFVEKRNYIVKYKELISDRYLIKYFQNRSQIEKWCKIIFIVENKRLGHENINHFIFSKRQFNDIDSMKEILGFKM